jgi:hypothetical protein
MAKNKSHDTIEFSKEMAIFSSNIVDGDTNTSYKLSSVLLNEFNYLP